jgi:NADPH:quinone reductase-like Zn-dependent oxidoreductase
VLTRTAIAARLSYLSAPDSLQVRVIMVRWSTRWRTLGRWSISSSGIRTSRPEGRSAMKAAVLDRHGGEPSYQDHPEPVLSAGRSLVRTSAAPIVPLDLFCAGGTSYFGPPALPYVPGVQGVGRIVESAAFLAGTRVWFATSAGMAPGDGSMAERCVVDDADLVAIDSIPSLDDAQVAAVGLSGVAAWMALSWRAGLRVGETVVVLGATGAVGRSALAAARHLGAGRVIGVCRGTSAEAELLALGADAVVSTGQGAVDPAELGERIAKAAGGPAQVVIDPVFGPVATAAAAALGPGGRLVNIGGTAGDSAEFSSAVLRGRSMAILGYTNNALSPTQRADALRSVLAVMDAKPELVRPKRFRAGECDVAWDAARSSRGRVVLEF